MELNYEYLKTRKKEEVITDLREAIQYWINNPESKDGPGTTLEEFAQAEETFIRTNWVGTKLGDLTEENQKEIFEMYEKYLTD